MQRERAGLHPIDHLTKTPCFCKMMFMKAHGNHGFNCLRKSKTARRLAFSAIVLLQCRAVFPGTAYHRPKIGLVLSGGGARGFAHIGVLKMLDSLRVPIDCIAGTSMGGIIGALYAVGFKGVELEEMALRTDWLEIFTDRAPRSVQPYFQKKESGRHQLEVGIEGFRLMMPTGLVAGQKISLLFSSLTFAYQNVEDFSDLPIPFRCVAADLNTGNEVILKSGSLSEAMRSTMAIPTIFSAVEWGDSLLIDGGILNNLPVDVVKEMGADIVIAVDVMGPQKGERNLHTVLDVFQHALGIVGMERWRKNIHDADILIRPALDGFTIADFFTEKIKRIVRRGDQAAHDARPSVERLKQRYRLVRLEDAESTGGILAASTIRDVHVTGLMRFSEASILERLGIQKDDRFDPAGLERAVQRLRESGEFESIHYEIVPVSEEGIRLTIRVREKIRPRIHSIQIEGCSDLPFRFVYGLLGFKPGEFLELNVLNRRVMELYGLGYFEHVRYDIRPADEGFVHLIIKVKEKSTRKLHLGARYDDFHHLVIAAGLQTTNFPFPGLRMEHELQFAGLTRFQSRIYYPSRTLRLPLYPFMRFEYTNLPNDIFDADGIRIARYRDQAVLGGVGMGFVQGRSFHAQFEYCYEYVDIEPKIAIPDTCLFPCWKDGLRVMRVDIRFDALDDLHVPRRGCLIQAQYEGSLKRLGSDVPFEALSIMADAYWTLVQRHTIRLYGFWGVGSKALPVYKYHNQGRPRRFIGVAYDRLQGKTISMVRADYRWEFKKNLFVTLAANWAFRFEYRSASLEYAAHNIRGYGIGFMLNTPLGTAEVLLGRGNKQFIGERRMANHAYVALGAKF